MAVARTSDRSPRPLLQAVVLVLGFLATSSFATVLQVQPDYHHDYYPSPHLEVRAPQKKHNPVAQIARMAYDMDVDADAARPPLECFQVAQPVLKPAGESVTVTLMDHQFANSYGSPFVGDYAPPDFDFDHVVLNFTVHVKGRQFDRWGSVYLGDVNIFSTSTAEPTASGIVWTWRKDTTPYLSLWRQPQTLIFQLDNVVNDVYTGLLNSTLAATFFKSPVQSGGQAPADLILPVSALKSPETASFWTYPEENATASLQFPRNVNRAVFSVNVKAQGNDEFWWSNVPQSAIDSFYYSLDSPLPGFSPFREVQLLIDGNLAGVHWPYPTVFTGGVVPQLHRPIVGIDAFDLRDHEIDVSPWLPLLCDGKSHTFEIKVVGLVDDGSANASLSNTTESSWYLAGKVFLWLDDKDSVTTGVVGAIANEDPEISFYQVIRQNATGWNESLDFSVSVKREFSIASQLSTQKGNSTATWIQSLEYSNLGSIYLWGRGAVNTFSSIGQESAEAPGWAYETSYSYPLFCNTTATLPEGNLTLWAELNQGLRLEVSGNTVYPTGLEAFEASGDRWVGSIISTDRDGVANYSRYADGSVTSGVGKTRQAFAFDGLSDEGKATQLYYRDVSAYNNTVTADREVVTGKVSDRGV
ncbi:peptide-n4-(n-acetyl-beta-glucosaminyl)asparagine amidase a [Colletotrichum musicola]|uniref:Peptide-n4-(N-acetyl-beta-glucosaminyl)asparagine amidase a n=1 Tax=Colletotrichum musicola TaxID=2175873 RepID=A0A8H6IW13_9PEZI|nr:peptide-n4-(n-acetyl-beta-glucosaminyl)asparagine amidase a [Colletotrichum musicola]